MVRINYTVQNKIIGFYGMIIFTIVSRTSFAVAVEPAFVETALSEYPQVFGRDTNIGLEIYNNTHEDVWVAVKNGNTFVPGVQKIVGNKGQFGSLIKDLIAQYVIDKDKNTTMALWLKNPGRTAVVKQYLIAGKPQWMPTPDRIYSFKTGKMIYVTWEPGDMLKPQMNLKKGTSRSGLSLMSNISADDINLKFSK